MSDLDKHLRCVECGDIDDLAYAVINIRSGRSRMERREPPYECEMCGGEMVVEDNDEDEDFDPEMN